MTMEIRKKQALKAAGNLAAALGAAFMIVKTFINDKNTINKERKEKEKNRALQQLFVKWLENEREGKRIASYLKELDISEIAIYGMSDAGKMLYEELKDTDISVAYAIDRRVIETEHEIDIVAAEDSWEPVEAIIVTAICDFAEIKEMLMQKTESHIISLEQIVYELNNM